MNSMEVLELWKKNLERTKSERTTVSYLRHLQCFIDTSGITTEDELLSITPTQIFNFVDTVSLGPSSLLANLSALRHFLRFLVRRDFISREKFADLEQAIEEAREEINSKKDPVYPKALTREEVKRIMDAVKGKRYEKVYSLFLYSGIRLGEYEKLEKDSFYLDKSGILWIRLKPHMTKRRKGRIAPVLGPTKDETFKATEKLLKWLDNYEENFCIKRGVLQVYTDRLSKRLDIPFSIHSFRHTYITNLVNSGFPVEVVKEFAGHASVKTTIETYYKYSHHRAQTLVRNFLQMI